MVETNPEFQFRAMLRKNIPEWYAQYEREEVDSKISEVLQAIFSERGYEYLGNWVWENRQDKCELDVFFQPGGLYARVRNTEKRRQIYFVPKDNYALTINSFFKKLDLSKERNR